MRFLAPSPLQNSSTRKIALLAGFSITSPRLPYWAGPRRRDRMGISYPSKNRPKSSIFRCRGVLQWALLFLAFSLFADTSLIEDIRPTIVVDAGHGGTDQGAKAKFPYCEEKRIALQTARLVKKYLDQLGYHVIMTRTTDTFIPLWRRVEIAKQSDAEIFV
ncbi:MAG: N-acetylmuramoyl-L-alanine amidase, partial [Chlamydiae bacterium]|nr:N-acetylmuramoyl-L-alanine amidase [Chlamydiota bacterium]